MSDTLPDDAVEVARIIGAYGVKGWIRVQPFADDPQALFSSKRWYLKPPDGPRPAGLPPRAAPLPTLLKVTQAREQGDAVVAGVQDVDDRDAAEALRGARIFISRASFPTAGPDEFYWVDLIGLSVVNRQGELLGSVDSLLDTGAHAVLRVRRGEGEAAEERLIPFVGAYVDTVDLAERRIQVDWGLDY